jgi:transcriptional regulator with XRE-family HTH domain
MRAVPVSPSNARLRIGARLRAERLRLGLTIEQLADSAGVTKGFLSRVERDETSPSVGTLIVLCEVLSLPIGTLFETPDTQLVRAADAPLINLGGTGAQERLLTPRRQGKVQFIRSEIVPLGNGGAEPYTLNCEIEVLHVLEGTIELVFRDGATRLDAGDTLTFSGREPHTWRNPDAKRRCVVVWVLCPAPWSDAS